MSWYNSNAYPYTQIQTIIECLPLDKLEAAEVFVFGKKRTITYVPNGVLSFSNCPPIDEDELLQQKTTLEQILITLRFVYQFFKMSFYFRDARTEEDEVEANIEEVDRIFEIIDNINKRGKPVTVKKFYTDSIQLLFQFFFNFSFILTRIYNFFR